MITLRTPRSHFVLARLVAAAAVALGALGAMAHDNVTAQATPEPESRCTTTHSTIAEPAIVPPHGSVTVTAHAAVQCSTPEWPLHIVLVLDISSSMAGEPLRNLNMAAKNFVNRLELNDHPTTRVGVVAYASSANILCDLGNNPDVLRACIDDLAVEADGDLGGTSIASGMELGIRALVRHATRWRTGRPRRYARS